MAGRKLPDLATLRTPKDVTVQIAVLGSTKSGKTAMVNQYVHNRFVSKYSETIEDLHKKERRLEDMYVMQDIVDTSGCILYDVFRKKVIKRSDVFILTFSLIDKKSFCEMKKIRQQVMTIHGSDAPILVVGTHSDHMNGRILRYKTAKTFVEKCWNHVYIECSSRFYDDAERVFDKAVRLLPLGTTFRSRLRSRDGNIYVMSKTVDKRRGLIGIQWKKVY